jgi:hypothetical protein
VDRGEIVTALTALGADLHAHGLTADMYVVGGAAIALAFDERRATRDIDAVFVPKTEVYAAADRVADDLGLPDGWLNDAVKGFLAGDDPDAVQVLDLRGLRCQVASPRMLLALKVLAHRVGEDDDDVRLLAGHLGLADADAVLDVVTGVLGEHRLTAQAQFFVEQVLARQDG